MTQSLSCRTSSRTSTFRNLPSRMLVSEESRRSISWSNGLERVRIEQRGAAVHVELAVRERQRELRFLHRGVGALARGEQRPRHDGALVVLARASPPNPRRAARRSRTALRAERDRTIASRARTARSSTSSVPSTKFALSRIESTASSPLAIRPARSSCASASWRRLSSSSAMPKLYAAKPLSPSAPCSDFRTSAASA